MTGTSRSRLLVLCPYPVGVAPSQRLKFEQYYDWFRENGIDVTVSPFMARRMWRIVYQRGRLLEKIWWTLVGYLRRLRDVLRAGAFDAVYIHLWVTPLGPPLFERLVRKVNPRIVYDIDDMVHIGHASRANSLVVRLKGRQKPVYLMKAARHVIVCTPTLDEVARRFNSRTTDISSTIDTDAYLPLVDHSRPGPVTIGWSGSHSTSRYLGLLEGALRRVRQHADIRLLVIGDGSFRFASLPTEALPWRRETEVADLRRIDVGVYPLPNEEWVYGKSGLKALQYMALGIPPVATAIGANHRVIEDGVSGFLVSTEDEWVARLLELVLDPALRARMGGAARARVERMYSVRANGDRYLTVLREVLSKAGKAQID